MSYMAGMLADMTAHEKHDLLVVALWVLVVIPIWAEVFLYPAYRVAAVTEPHEPPRVRWRLRCFGLGNNYSVIFAG
jgi:hypothetical protein